MAADIAHNATVQEVIFQVEQAYFAFLAAEAFQEAAKKSLEDAEKHLEAAKTRKDVGLATALDVMQARTAVAEAKLQLASLVGQLESVRGSLAPAMGYPATVTVSVAAVLPEVEQLQELERVEELVAQALVDNPEVQAARARPRQAEAKLYEEAANKNSHCTPSTCTGGQSCQTGHANPLDGGGNCRFPTGSAGSAQGGRAGGGDALCGGGPS